MGNFSAITIYTIIYLTLTALYNCITTSSRKIFFFKWNIECLVFRFVRMLVMYARRHVNLFKNEKNIQLILNCIDWSCISVREIWQFGVGWSAVDCTWLTSGKKVQKKNLLLVGFYYFILFTTDLSTLSIESWNNILIQKNIFRNKLYFYFHHITFLGKIPNTISTWNYIVAFSVSS